MAVAVLFVCLGNICRSPTAQGVFRRQVEEAGLAQVIAIDSAGTGDWHLGKAPDHRALAAAQGRGYDLSDFRARQVTRDDFHRFDYILAMDQMNLRELVQLSPPDYAGHLGLFLDLLGDGSAHREVPDPYFGGSEGFEQVLDLVERASTALLTDIQRRHLSS